MRKPSTSNQFLKPASIHPSKSNLRPLVPDVFFSSTVFLSANSETGRHLIAFLSYCMIPQEHEMETVGASKIAFAGYSLVYQLGPPSFERYVQAHCICVPLTDGKALSQGSEQGNSYQILS